MNTGEEIEGIVVTDMAQALNEDLAHNESVSGILQHMQEEIERLKMENTSLKQDLSRTNCYQEAGTEQSTVLHCASVTQDEPSLPPEYSDFKDVFDPVKASVLPPHRSYDCRIDLIPGAPLPNNRVYALTDEETKYLRTYLDDLLQSGFIRHSTSPVSSPLFFIPKPDKSLRARVDYRGLNKATIKNKYPLPLIPVLLDQLRHSTVYTKLDLRGAYHLVRVKEGDEWKTAFKTKFGLFEYTVMPFGLCNAPAAFQFFINEVLHEFLDVCVIVYIDDILIYSKNSEEHTQHVRAVLSKLKENHLFAKLEKCTFNVNKVDFLGYCPSPQGITMDVKKISAIADWPEPSSVKDIQKFLGFANFYRRFIAHFADIAAPITTLLRKGQRFLWTDEAAHAFQLLKQKFTSAPILKHPDPDLPFFVEADASQVALGGVLSQRDAVDGQLHPIAFYSKKLLPAEQNYTVAERELLAIKVAFSEWRHHLMGAKYPVTIFSDHKNLQFFGSLKALTPRQMRWLIFFSTFDFVITYRPGAQQIQSDVLSRYGHTSDMKQDKIGEPIIPPQKVLAPVQQKDFITDLYNAHMQIAPQDWLKDSHNTIQRGLLYHDNMLLVPTSELQTQVIIWHHASPLAGHPGWVKTLENVQKHFWWDTIRKDIKQFVTTCPICTRHKSSHKAPDGLLIPMPTPKQPWHTVSVDFIVGLPPVKSFTTVLVIVDFLSKMAHFVPLRKLPTAAEFADIFIREIVRLHGLPSKVVSDRGSQFNSRFWKKLCEKLKIDVALSTAFHPETDGQTERLNQTLLQTLRCLLADYSSEWLEALPVAEFVYNNTEHSALLCSPFYFLQGYHPRAIPILLEDSLLPTVTDRLTRLGDIQDKARKHLLKYKESMKRQADKHRSEAPMYKIGDKVWLTTKNQNIEGSRKLQPRFIGPFSITAIVNPVTVKLDLPKEYPVHTTFHVSLLKPYN
ncbi:hypothetical protein NDU88_003471 [Pleurodeles waltl]|uniref:Gypsy retrotransposon integrase-like protein 1 n=1 Tax=Pleurodeles waltl TaxID=8319 RepID=A0AAV7T682_PLEWA|nr:hypothetical protein NDU88_003471 [Pleurodeles waltl]